MVPNPRISAGSTVDVTWLHLGADPGVCHAKTKKERLICKNASFEISVQLTTEVISTIQMSRACAMRKSTEGVGSI